MIDQFTLQEFEQALPIDKDTGEFLCIRLGLIQGEYSYLLPIDDRTGIIIRSGISRDGISAGTGDDSLRAWLVTYNVSRETVTNIKPLGSKVSRWTTRRPGWQKRFIHGENSVVRQLWRLRKRAGDCPMCGIPKGIFKVKKSGPNKDRMFAKCQEHNQFEWLTEAK